MASRVEEEEEEGEVEEEEEELEPLIMPQTVLTRPLVIRRNQ